jgi:LmbE family N-acetylglucosaminyl deacetylase
MTTAITSRFFKRLVQIILVIASLWIYLTVFSPYLGRSQMSLPSLIEPTSNDRILVIVAHPDDEILGAAGYIKKTIEKGGEAHIVIVTNGDANKFYYISAERLFYKNKQFFIEEGNERINETINAIAKLGLNDDHIDFLGFPDRGLNNLLTSNWNHSQPYFSPYTKTTQSPYINTFDPSSNYSGEDLVKNLKQIIKEVQPTKIFTHTIFDIHPDHRATAEFVNLALKELKTSDDFKDPNLYSFLVHYRDYPRPLGYEPDHYLSPPKDLLENSKISWFVFPLDSELQEAKHQATLQFKSQLKSPFLNLLLKSFIRKNELFIEIK